MTIIAKIDVTKIDKARLFKGQKGTYLDLVIIEKQSEYGDFMICQGVSKEERERGVKGAILGNGRYLKAKTSQAPQPAVDTPEQIQTDDVPF